MYFVGVGGGAGRFCDCLYCLARVFRYGVFEAAPPPPSVFGPSTSLLPCRACHHSCLRVRRARTTPPYTRTCHPSLHPHLHSPPLPLLSSPAPCPQHPQEEYRKGVSSWNFDLAALKAQAALEPDDDSSAHGAASMLPTISESDEREDTLTGTSAAAAQAFLVAQAEEQAAAAAGAGAGGTGAGSAAAAGEAARSFMSAFGGWRVVGWRGVEMGKEQGGGRAAMQRQRGNRTGRGGYRDPCGKLERTLYAAVTAHYVALAAHRCPSGVSSARRAATVSGQESTARTGSVLPLAAPSPTPAPMTVDGEWRLLGMGPREGRPGERKHTCSASH